MIPAPLSDDWMDILEIANQFSARDSTCSLGAANRLEDALVDEFSFRSDIYLPPASYQIWHQASITACPSPNVNFRAAKLVASRARVEWDV